MKCNEVEDISFGRSARSVVARNDHRFSSGEETDWLSALGNSARGDLLLDFTVVLAQHCNYSSKHSMGSGSVFRLRALRGLTCLIISWFVMVISHFSRESRAALRNPFANRSYCINWWPNKHRWSRFFDQLVAIADPTFKIFRVANWSNLTLHRIQRVTIVTLLIEVHWRVKRPKRRSGYDVPMKSSLNCCGRDLSRSVYNKRKSMLFHRIDVAMEFPGQSDTHMSELIPISHLCLYPCRLQSHLLLFGPTVEIRNMPGSQTLMTIQ
jgi:hypothetical protein